MFGKTALLKFYCIILASLLSTTIHAQTPVDAPKGTKLKGVSNVEMQLDQYGRPTVKAKINGVDVELRVDLGSNAFALSEDGLNKLNLETSSGEYGPMAQVNTIQIGEATFIGMTAAIIPMLNNIADGLIGYPTFKELLVTFDFPNKNLILEKGTLPEVNNQEILKWIGEDVGRRPDVSVSIEDISLPGVLDTQGSGWLKMPESYMEQIPTMGSVSNLTGTGPTLGQMQIQRVRVDSDMKIGKYVVKKPIVFFRDRPGIVIGSAFLNQFAITLDQTNDRIRFSKEGSNVIEVPQEEWETDSESQSKTADNSSIPNELQAYVGTYGNRAITYENGKLHLQRLDAASLATSPNERVIGPKLLLVRESGDEFYLERIPTAKIKFVRGSDNQVTELHVLNPQGEWEKTKKDQ